MLWESEWTIYGLSGSCGSCGWETDTKHILDGTVPTDIRMVMGSTNPRRIAKPSGPKNVRARGWHQRGHDLLFIKRSA